MMTMAFPVTAFGIWVELAYEPPLWVHFATTLPLLLLACIPILRPIKASLLLVNTSTRPRKDASRNPKSKDAQMNRATVAGGEALEERNAGSIEDSSHRRERYARRLAW